MKLSEFKDITTYMKIYMQKRNIDYYTISHRNAKIFYDLDKPQGYYNYYDVLAEAREVHNDNEEVLKKINENQLAFESIMNDRKSREDKLRDEFEKHNIEFIRHSYLVRNHIMYGKFYPNYVVSTMYKMKLLFENCNIKQAWEKYKIDAGKKFYSSQEKDHFYNEVYDNYIALHPEYVMS